MTIKTASDRKRLPEQNLSHTEKGIIIFVPLAIFVVDFHSKIRGTVGCRVQML
jgi:hypothetical protein